MLQNYDKKTKQTSNIGFILQEYITISYCSLSDIQQKSNRNLKISRRRNLMQLFFIKPLSCVCILFPHGGYTKLVTIAHLCVADSQARFRKQK